MDNRKTAMQQLLNQLKEERHNLPMDIEWDRCYQAIELVIQNTYLLIEKEQMIDAFGVGCQVESTRLIGYHKMAEQYYNETYGK
jgi:hypothetical protein